jgi:hypothetical protein
MNSIRADWFKSQFVSEPHLIIRVDGEPLDEFLENHSTGLELRGLIPAWLAWLTNDAEQAVVWERMIPPLLGRVRVPVLMCPDDLDFSCQLIIADLEVTPEVIVWHRIGSDISQSMEPRRVGEEVAWFESIPPLRFPRNDYEACVASFVNAAKRPTNEPDENPMAPPEGN